MRKLQIPNRKGYAFINGKLIACYLAQVSVEFHKEEQEDKVVNVPTITKMVVEYAKGTKTADVELANFYDSIEDYREGNAANICDNNVYLGSYFHNVTLTDTENKYYLIENGKVVCKEFDFTRIDVFLNTEATDWRWVDGVGSPDIPTNAYSSKEEAFAHLDIEVVNEDGESTKTIGIANLLALDKEQAYLVGQISELMQKANNLGVKFVNDMARGTLHAINTNNVEYARTQYSGDCDVSYNLNGSNDFDMHVQISYLGDEDVIEYKLK